MAHPADLLRQAKHFVALHTAELKRWEERVKELTAEVEGKAKETVAAAKAAVIAPEPVVEAPKEEAPEEAAPAEETPEAPKDEAPAKKPAAKKSTKKA
jgi:hypothetical protein